MAPLETKLVGVAGGFVFLAVLLVLGKPAGPMRPTVQALVLLTAGVLFASQVVSAGKIVARSRN